MPKFIATEKKKSVYFNVLVKTTLSAPHRRREKWFCTILNCVFKAMDLEAGFCYNEF